MAVSSSAGPSRSLPHLDVPALIQENEMLRAVLRDLSAALVPHDIAAEILQVKEIRKSSYSG